MNNSKCMPTTFGIFGTCVSVDVFLLNHCENKNLSDKTAMRDCSLMGFNGKRPQHVLSESIKHSSSLHTMWLNTIYDGKVFQFMRENAGEYLIIDLVDERFSTFRFEDSVFIEQWFSQSNFFDLVKREDCDFGDYNNSEAGIEFTFSGDEIEQNVKFFCEQILQIYDSEKIIINEFYLAHKYVKNGKVGTFDDKVNNMRIYKSDKLFPLLYAFLKKYIPGCKVMKFNKEYMADDKNPRGLSPTHNSLDYYDDTYKKLQLIIENDYAAQRKIPMSKLENIDSSVYLKRTEEFKGLGCDTDYLARIFSRISFYTTFEGKNVLWISGKEVSPSFIRKLKINKFAMAMYSLQEKRKVEYFDKHRLAYSLSENFTNPNVVFEDRNFAYYWGEIQNFSKGFADLFDIIFIDDLEEVNLLELCLDNVYKCLKRGGKFFGKTGRTWSSSYGNKWNINSECNYLNSKRIPQYAHLLMNFQEANDFLQKENLTIKAEDLLQGVPGLNHLFYEDYEYLVQNSLFRKKNMAPLLKETIDSNILNNLKKKYPGYKLFDYKSLFIYCEK